MAEEKKLVSVKLHARSFVNGEIREKDAIVELPELADDGKPLAAVFGEIQKGAAPKAAATTTDAS